MKSDMPAQGSQYQAKEIGRNLYVWSIGKGQSKKRCVISAHGASARISNEAEHSKLPRSVQVVFYGPHGQYLNNPGLYEIATGLQLPYEAFTTNNMGQDYELSKSQDAHQGGGGTKNESKRGTAESYKFIGEQMHDMKSYDDKLLAGWDPAMRAQTAANRGNYERKIIMDVVTVRSRKLFADMTLFQVINQLWASGYQYEEIHCAFCRGAGATPSSWNPAQNKGL